MTREIMKEGRFPYQLHVVMDGEAVLPYLRHEGEYEQARRPQLILLDLNLPKKDGREVLAEIKTDPTLSAIPVIVLTTSKAREDILRAYELHANCYITKPLELDQFAEVLSTIGKFWFQLVQLPPYYAESE